ncbi:uncharacterized protein LOC106665210 isoform X2 [Cimex lectularius]|uniref:Uncharacterized protein n=1 Tax=Cimex lectularius TaxID=79782 RepID=A0A8I6RN52_CIMLE|nr:uncharacterized protein LOC106665210 isoform X2 [Cimex lectularius]
MVQIRNYALVLAFVGASLAIPVELDENDVVIVRQRPAGGLLGTLGTALVPLVGTILGPLITNIATGLTNALTVGLQNTNLSATLSTRPSFYNPSIRTTESDLEAYIVQIPGANTPYMLINNRRITTPTQDLDASEEDGKFEHDLQEDEIESKRRKKSVNLR